MDQIRTRGATTVGTALVLAAVVLLAVGAGLVHHRRREQDRRHARNHRPRRRIPTRSIPRWPEPSSAAWCSCTCARSSTTSMGSSRSFLSWPRLFRPLPADKKSMTIRIRRGVRSNDGTPLTAQAVKVSLDRHRTLRGSARASEISGVSSVDVVGSNAVRLRLTDRFSPLTAQLADRAGMIMSPKQIEALGDRFASNPVCVGAFRLVSRTAGDRIVLAKSPFYYARNKVKLDQLVFRIITDTAHGPRISARTTSMCSTASPRPTCRLSSGIRASGS